MKQCGRCGRRDDERVMGRARGVPLCHANLDGTKADPDCYHLVTVYGEPLDDDIKQAWLRGELEVDCPDCNPT